MCYHLHQMCWPCFVWHELYIVSCSYKTGDILWGRWVLWWCIFLPASPSKSAWHSVLVRIVRTTTVKQFLVLDIKTRFIWNQSRPATMFKQVFLLCKLLPWLWTSLQTLLVFSSEPKYSFFLPVICLHQSLKSLVKTLKTLFAVVHMVFPPNI